MALSPEQVQAIQLILDNMKSKIVRLDEMRDYVAGILTYNDEIDQPAVTLMEIINAMKASAKTTADELVEILE